MSGVTLGEFGETLRMVRRPLQSLRSSFNSYFSSVKKRTKGMKTKKQVSGVIADTWLEYSFGWRPLVADIHDGIDAFQRIQRKAIVIAKYVTGSETEFIPISVSSLLEGVSNCPNIFYRRELTVQQMRHVKFYGVVGIRTDTSKLPIKREVLGLTLDNFVPTVYELLPWSFLVDYFTNLGGWLNVHSFQRSRVLWVGCTTRLVGERHFWYYPDTQRMINSAPSGSTGKGAYAYGSPSHRIMRSSSVNREAKGNLVCSLHFKIPGLSTQWANIAGLLAARKENRRMFSRLG
jgi:hypothetical protein